MRDLIKNKLEIKLINLLLFYGIDPDTQNKGLNSLGYISVLTKSEYNVNITKLLLQYGSNPNILYDYDAPLLLASEYNNKDIVILLIQYGANPNIQNDEGVTALALSASCNHKEIAMLLLQHGANPNLKNHYAEHSLLYAVMGYRYYKDMAVILLLYGANPYIKRYDGKSAFDIAEENNFHKFPKLVEKYYPNTLTKICILRILNNFTLYKDKLDTLPEELRYQINNLKKKRLLELEQILKSN